MAVRLYAVVTVAAITLMVFCGDSRAQSGRVRDDLPPPSIATLPSHPFVSPEGKFSISLPDVVRDRHPIKIEGAGETITGETVEWDTAEGRFTISYMDLPVLLSGSAGARTGLDRYREQTLKQIAVSKGKIISDRDIVLSGTAGAEIKAEMSGLYYTFRGCVTARRLYQLMVVTPKSVDLPATDRVMESFRLLDNDGPSH
ncbi:MAG TPA: hypothetical protein VI756_18505 [Blastocatellia bacterium]